MISTTQLFIILQSGSMKLRSLNESRKVSIRDIMKINDLSIREQQPKTNKYPPCHIQSDDSESFQATPSSNQLLPPEIRANQRKKIFKKQNHQTQSHNFILDPSEWKIKAQNTNSNAISKYEQQRRSQEKDNLGLLKIQPSLPHSNANANPSPNTQKQFMHASMRLLTSSKPVYEKNLPMIQEEQQIQPYQQKMINEDIVNNFPHPRQIVDSKPVSPNRTPSFAVSQQSQASVSPNIPVAQSIEKIKRLEQKIQIHDEEIFLLREMIQKLKRQEHEEHRKMLSDLIKKEESLCEKQAELNTQLQRIIFLEKKTEFPSCHQHRNSNRINELQRERQRRIQELEKDNKKLYQDIERIELERTRNQSSKVGVGFFKDQNSHSISALNPLKYEFEDEDNQTLDELLSPFAINSEYFD